MNTAYPVGALNAACCCLCRYITQAQALLLWQLRFFHDHEEEDYRGVKDEKWKTYITKRPDFLLNLQLRGTMTHQEMLVWWVRS